MSACVARSVIHGPGEMDDRGCGRVSLGRGVEAAVGSVCSRNPAT